MNQEKEKKYPQITSQNKGFLLEKLMEENANLKKANDCLLKENDVLKRTIKSQAKENTESDNSKLREKNIKQNEEINNYKICLEDTNTVIFSTQLKQIKISEFSDNKFFIKLLGKELINVSDITESNYFQYVHPEDRDSLRAHRHYYSEGLDGKIDNFSLIFRAINNVNNNYKWFLLKVKLNNKNKDKCSCIITEFDISIFSPTQAECLENEKIKERNSEIISKLTKTEIQIMRYISQGMKHEEIKDKLKFSSMAYLNRAIEKLFIKTNTNNSASLAYTFGALGLTTDGIDI